MIQLQLFHVSQDDQKTSLESHRSSAIQSIIENKGLTEAQQQQQIQLQKQQQEDIELLADSAAMLDLVDMPESSSSNLISIQVSSINFGEFFLSVRV